MKEVPLPDPGRPDIRSPLRYLLWLARMQWTSVALGAFWGVLWMGSLALLPAMLGWAVNSGIVARDPGELVKWSLLILALGAASAFTGLERHRIATMNSLTASLRSVQVVVRHLPEVGADLPRMIDPGDVITVAVADIFSMITGFGELPITIGAIVAVVLVAIILLHISVALGLVVIIGAPGVMALTAFLIKPLRGRQSEYRELQSELSTRASDIASGVRVLRGIGGERQFAAAYRTTSQATREAGFQVARVSSLLSAIQTFGPGAFTAAVTWMAAGFALHREISVGSLVACYGYATFLTLPLSTLAGATRLATGLMVAAERAVNILRLQPELTDPPNPASASADRPGQVPALADGSSGLACVPGGMLAVVCRDSADVDSLARRLARYEDTGDPTLDGIRLSSIPVRKLRSRVLLAGNDDHIFAGTLRSLLDPDDSQERGPRLEEAIDAACADDVLKFLDDGIDSEIDDGGRNLSGGQQQRVRLARALVADPEVLILVDPTSALDAHTESSVAERLPRFREGRTTIVFTKSPLLLDRADMVSYIEAGKVVARGLHRDVLSDSPAYRTTVMRGEA